MFKKVFPLSAILSLRFLGLFLVLPVISIYAASMTDNLLLVGIIVGGYALTQAIFQVPFGVMSDKIGRKPTLLVGLIIFLIGSLIAAFATDIYTLMLGRFLQGAGAIGAVITAMISDLVEEEVRGKAMAIMGASIAVSFAIAMGLGPVIGAKENGVETLFIITAGLSIIAIILLFTKVPTPPRIIHTYHATAKTSDILKDSNLLNMIIINAMQKGLMTVAFVLIPIILTSNEFDWEKSDLYMAYLPAMVLGLVAMGPAAVFGEKHNKPKQIFLASIVLFIGSFAIMGLTSSSTLFIVAVSMFFIAFNMMEPLVQSMISKFAKVHQKGAALGISNSVAYFATFIGGTTAGLMLQNSDRATIGVSVAVLATIWLLWTLKLQNPTKYSHLFIPQTDVDTTKLDVLESEHIAEWYINETEGKVVVKFVASQMSEDDLRSKISK